MTSNNVTNKVTGSQGINGLPATSRMRHMSDSSIEN